MNRREQMWRQPRKSRRSAVVAVVAVVSVLAMMLLAGCGVPGAGHVRTVDADSVPYHLLEPDWSASVSTDSGSVPRRVPVVFWLLADDHLVPATAGGSCRQPSVRVIRRLLAELAVGPTQEARASGRSSALPSSTGLRLLGFVGGLAQVELDPSTAISADRLPLAVGQLVLSLTSSPGVRKVALFSSGEPVQVPLPGGALTTRAVSAEDYASLLPSRYREPTGRGSVLAATIGCQVG
ncbi:MAG: GerMN domain-containing protein [Nocardioides sp.]